jgi:hypothetical protein
MTPPLSLPDKVSRHRQRLRAAGLRPVQFWVQDTRQPGFAEEVRRQCLLLQHDEAEDEACRFAEAAAQSIDGWR